MHLYKKKKISYISILLVLSLIFSSCSFFSKEPTNKELETQEAFESFLEEEFKSSFEDDLISLHYTLKNPEEYDIEKPEKAFTEISLESAEESKEELNETKEKLEEINERHLTEEQKRVYQTLEKYLDQQIALADYPQFTNVLSYATGLSSNLPLTLAEYSFYTEEDVKDYLAILTQVPAALEESFALEEELTKQGYGMADFEIEHTIKQIDTFLGIENDSDEEEANAGNNSDDKKETGENTDTDNLLISTFSSRIASMEGISVDQKKTYISNNNELVNNTVIPAFTKLKEDLNGLKASAKSKGGLYNYEGGLEYYELLLASMTLADHDISTLINTLENRMEDLTKDITQIMMTAPVLFDVFAEETVFSDETPAEMLEYLKEAMKEDFPEVEEIAYIVEPIPEALKNDSTAAYYLIPPIDSQTENRIYYGDATEDSANLFMTLSHEGYPGHLYHQNYLMQQGMEEIFSVMNMTGYKEGWAFYVEMEATDYYDFGEYEEEYHDELVDLYRCNLEYSYCLSSLIDLYVNGEGRTREEIVNFASNLGFGEETGNTLYEFAVEEPGTYLQYYIGYLEILEMRHEAEKKAGDDFHEKEFHEAYLSLGPCYYEDLKSYMKKEY